METQRTWDRMRHWQWQGLAAAGLAALAAPALASAPVDCSAHAGDPANAFLCEVGFEFKAGVSLLHAVAVIMGIAFIGFALREFVEHHRSRGDGKGIVRGLNGLLAGALLLSLPWTMDLVSDTVLVGQESKARESITQMNPLTQYEGQ